MKIKLIVLGLFIVLLTISCGVNDWETVIKPIEPGRRDYVWEVDTSNTPGGMINCIWGSSPTDVWAVGNSPYVSHSEIWHYGGISWEMFTDISYYWNPSSMFGFSENDIWIGGGGGDFYNYDGNSWEKIYDYENNTLECMTINAIWGENPSNIYAIALALKPGNNIDVYSLILHYDGNVWKEVFRNDKTIQYYAMRGYKNDLYIVGQTDWSTSKVFTKIYKYSNNSLKEIYSIRSNQIIGCDLEIIGKELYFMIGKSLMKYNDTTFTEILKFDYENYASYVCGRNEKDMFFFMHDGIIHYNGIDYQYIYEFPLNEIMLFSPPTIFENDIFITAMEINGNKNRIIHGHLQN